MAHGIRPGITPGIRVIRPADIAAQPWANGLGATQIMETCAAWRISIAEITGRMPFSAFPGMERTLIPLSPGGITLEIAGEPRIVRPKCAAQFRGEDEVVGDSGSHPATVVNVMVQRSLTNLSCEILRAGTLDLAGIAAVVVLGGDVSLGDDLLAPGTVIIPSPVAAGTAETAGPLTFKADITATDAAGDIAILRLREGADDGRGARA